MHGKNSKETSRRATSAIWRIFAELNNPIRALSKTELNIDGGKQDCFRYVFKLGIILNE